MPGVLTDLFGQVEAALLACDVNEKRRLVEALPGDFSGPEAAAEISSLHGYLSPGRPELPSLVHPAKVKKRRLNTVDGRLALIHAVAHIEFNAINLALDAVWRFRGMPLQYYRDWLSVARDESRHFGWLQRRLTELGSHYGAYTAHNGLWEAAVKTAHDPLLRMALVPRVLEARGLDVTPGMIDRLRQAGDLETVSILENILNEEIGHVEIGSRWYKYLCSQRQLDAEALFPKLLSEHMQGTIRGPLNLSARRLAGFTETELVGLQSALS